MARKILLADDSVTAQNMGRKILADAGYEVIAVNNGSAALKKIAELKPELVILDVYMPGYSGLEVCQRLKESPETARIPVLLSVGKLEPFKPQEAQRVRAEGYIVKPFEASELLSALAKLEDKIVPRAEPSKPGRFARAVAAVDESNGSRAAADEAGGWKSRISSPRRKTERDAKAGDEAEIYNIVNRDLRTVVETAAENASGTEQKQQSDLPSAETNVDVAALAQTSLPTDVTPEEIAAIAAAAAQIQMAADVLQEESQTASAPDAAVAPIAAAQTVEVEPAEELESPAQEIQAQEIQAQEIQAHETQAQETHEEPVTMAVTESTVVGARWMAVPVALGSEEAGLSLDQEMQRSYAAFAAVDTHTLSVSALAEAVSVDNSIATPEAEPVTAEKLKHEPEVVSAAATIPKSEAESASESVVSPVAVEAATISVAQPETAVDASPTANHFPDFSEPTMISEPYGASEIVSAAAEMPAPGISLEAQSSNEFVQTHPEPTPVTDFTGPAMENRQVENQKVETQSVEPQCAEPVSPQAHEAESNRFPEPDSAEVGNESSVAFAAIVRETEHPVENRLDPEAVKTTAAAWASWRQIRDSSQNPQATPLEAKPEEIEAPAPTDVAAMAVAAGAEHAMQESQSAASSRAADVASIVDSVLAGLRPKLMEEIARKMAEKK